MEHTKKTVFPDDWEDEERMNFLFSDFKENREVHPSDWDSKMEFWTSLVLQTCRTHGAVSLSLKELNAAFKRNGRLPLGLTTVIQSMARCGKLQRESEFAANVDSGWLSWGVGVLLVKPLKWTFSTLLGSSLVSQDESFVVIELVKEKAADLMEAYRSSAFSGRSLLSFQELSELCSEVCPGESSLCLALLQLQREKRCTVSVHEGEKIVKFSRPGQCRVSPVSDVDVGIYQLQCSENLLGERIKVLGLEADKCREEARMLLRDRKKSQALRCLRGRKRVEKRADNLFAQLETIRGILDRIAQSQTDKLVMQAYQTGVAALRLALKDVTVEGAESLVDQIQELCDVQEDVNQTLAGVATSDENVDELEEELKALMEDADEMTDRLPGVLPEVPHNPLVLPRETAQGGSSLLASLPDVPTNTFNISDQQLEEELNRLTLRDSDFGQKKRLEPAL
ncbi:charged multivesicular body protein 7 [Gadus morhua]|uniref:Charged multivesicular body protein 7 n=1 Tax=Gadus morhua TaxID=8049 RepID=A0A8C5C4E6_GADMO|nr:charged multivesicular body protein 7 [Gadus morhua]